MTEEALLRGDPGLVPEGEGWFVVNVRDARWKRNPRFGSFCAFEGDTRFSDFGINVHVLQANQPACLYHRENQQEGFLVLYGEPRVLIQGEERSLRPWDYVHSPPGTDHVFVGGAEGPSAILMIGARGPDTEIVYPVDPLARRHGASAAEETPDPRRAYEGTPPSVEIESPWNR